jgi:hypothetical protein
VKLTTMKMGLSVCAIVGLVAASSWAQNSSGAEPADVRSDTHDIRQDRRDVRQDAHDRNVDNRDIRSDRSQLLEDKSQFGPN